MFIGTFCIPRSVKGLRMEQNSINLLSFGFADEGFDDESFALLTDETIKEVIPKLGLRIKFMSLHRTEVR